MSAARTIVADPPWHFGDKLPGPSRGAVKNYPTMDYRAIAEFEKPPIADDARLFLWRVASMQHEALHVMHAWGFTLKAEIVWVKTTNAGDGLRIGGGHYTRICTEPMLLCRRGKAKVSRRNIPNVIFAPRTVHSAKPDESYELIEDLTGASRFLELFARRQWSPQWTVWGDQLGEAA